MSNIQSRTVSAGDTINVSNHGEKGIRVTVKTADGTAIESHLHPGASCKTTVGTQQVDVFILDAEQKYDNFEIV